MSEDSRAWGLWDRTGASSVPGIVSFDEQAGVLWVAGDEDRATAGCRRRPISTALRAGRDVLVDLRELRFADSSLVVDLAVLAQHLRREGRQLRLYAPQPHVQRLFEAAGLHRLPAVAFEG